MATVTVPADGSVTLVDLPVGTYTVAESDTTVAVNGYQYQWSVSGGGDVEVTTSGASSTITNTITGTARLVLTKNWSDLSNKYSTRPENDGTQFAVTLTATNATDGKTYTYTTTAVWTESGDSWMLVYDGVAAFDENGAALTYEITESGTFDLSNYTLSGDTTVTPAADRNAEWTNTLKTTTVTVNKVVLDMDGNTVTSVENEDNFRFVLYTYVDGSAVSIGTATISADGTATFYDVPLGTVYLTEYLVGSHVHSYDTTVSVSGTGVSNVSAVSERYAYDSTENAYVKYHTVNFDVAESGAAVSVTVTNQEESVSVDLAALINGIKTLSGTDAATKTFTYTVNQSMDNPNADEDAGATVATGTVTVSTGDSDRPITWTISQPGAFIYTEVGTYTYVIYEDEATGTGSGGVIYDSTRYTLTVVVSKDANTGELIATVSMTKSVENSEGSRTVTDVTIDGSDSVTSFVADSTHKDYEDTGDSFTASFVNTYDASETSIILRATKTLTGRSLETGEFTIWIQELDEGGYVIADTLVERSNGAAGAFGYEIVFDTQGTYWFKVSEEPGGLSGVTYDTHYYIVEVVVEDINGVLTVVSTSTTYYDASGRTQLGSTATYDSMVFKNTYKAVGEATLSVYKVLDGRDFNDDDEFTFKLEALDSSAPFADTYETDEETGNRYITVTVTGADLKQLTTYETNGDTALFLIQLLTLTLDQDDVGSWEYRVTEIAPTGAVQNDDGTYTLDDLPYDTQTYGHLITLVVTDNGSGYLDAATYSTNDTDWNGDNETDTSSAVIVNTFDAGSMNIYGRKTWVDGGLSHTDNETKVQLTLYYTTDENPDEDTVWTLYEDTYGSYTVNWGTLYTNDWDILNLPVYDASGKKITYKVVETGIDGYETTYSNDSDVYDADVYDSSTRFTVINTLEQDDVVLNGTKTWVDGGLTHNNAQEITLTVTRNSEAAPLKTLTQVSGNGTGEEDTYIVVWSGDTYKIYWYWTAQEGYVGLPQYDDSRYEYYYSVAETLKTSNGYNYTSGSDMDVDTYTFNFTNTRDSEDPEASKTETSINDASAGTGTSSVVNGKSVTQYGEVSVGDTITYEISYYNGYNTESQITITDVLDAGVEYVIATNPESWSDTVNNSFKEENGTVTWTFTAQPFESGTVTLTVEVTEAAKTINASAETTATVENQATVVIAENSMNTDIVSNPLEDEEQQDPEKELVSVTDGDDAVQTDEDDNENLYVSVGDTLVYRIHFENDSNTTKTIYLVDTLDEGVTFVGANRSGVYYDTATTLTIDGKTVEVPAGSVIWELTVQPFQSGYVRLYVTVNENALNAEQTYQAEGELTYTDTASIANQAYAYIGNTTTMYTSVIENPIQPENPVEPVKSETAITGADEISGTVGGESLTDETVIDENTTVTYNTVDIGDIIEYDIAYYNNLTGNATITITDQLDDGVRYVDATGDNGEVDGMTTSYNADTRTVTWVIENVTPLTGGSVKLQVQVTHDAIEEGAVENSVVNQAGVQVGTQNTQKTNIVENPVDDDPGDPAKLVADDSEAGVDGANVKAGDQITYEITYYNHNSTAAQITIRDMLDENVTLVSATDPDSWTGEENGSWEKSTTGLLGTGDTVVTWTFTAAAYEVGTVTITVEVSDTAVEAGSVVNNASVQIGNEDAQDVDPVENPVDDDPEDPVKTETAITDVDDDDLVGTVDGKTLTDAAAIGKDSTVIYNDVTVGDEITYTISYYNHYGTPADITVTDILDAGVDYVSADGTYTQVSTTDGSESEVEADVTKSVTGTTTTVTWTLTNVKAYEHGTVTLTVKVTDDAKSVTSGETQATVDNRAAVTVGEVENKTNQVVNPLEDDERDDSKSVDIDHDYDYEDDNETVRVDDQLTYQIRFYNNTDSAADVTITDVLDEGVDFVIAHDENGEAESDGYDADTHTYTWTVEDVAPFTYGTVTLVVKVNEKAMTYAEGETDAAGNAAAIVDNQATVTIGETDNDTNLVINPLEDDDPEAPVKTETAITDVDTADLAGTVGGEALTENTVLDENTTVEYNSVNVGDEITYTISYYNHLNEAAGVTVTDALDEGVDFVSATDENGNTVTAGYDSEQHVYTWNIPDVSPMSAGSVTLTVRVNDNAKLTENVGDVASVENQATITVGEAENDTNVVVNPLESDDSEEPVKAVSESSPSGQNGESVGIGSIIAYTIDYYNYTNEKTVVTITDKLDAGVDFLSASDDGVYNESAHTVTWTQTVDSLTSGTVVLNVQVNENATTIASDETQATVENQATVTIGENDYDTNLVINPIDPDEPGDLEKAVSADSAAGTDGASVSVGDQITYEIGYYNHTNETADVTIIDELQTGAAYISSSDNGTETDGVVSWTIEDVAPYTGGTVTLTIEVTEDAVEVTQITNDAVVQVGDNTATTNLVVNPVDDDPEDPVKSVDAGDGTAISVGDKLVYTISYYNNLSTAADITIEDILDDGVIYKSSSDSGVYNGDTNTVTWTLTDVAAYERGTVTVTVQVNENAKIAATGETASVTNQASLTVGNQDKMFSNTVENPIDPDDPADPTKSVDVGDRTEVSSGDRLVYTITYYNHLNTSADVTITDTLDEGLTFVSASDGGTYNAASRTVTWTIEDVAAFTEGAVTLTVDVNDDAESSVVNTAKVSIGGNSAVSTNTVTNTVKSAVTTSSTTTTTTTTKTGDTGLLYLWILLLFASGAGLCILGIYSRKKSRVRK
ncbi:MAG: DUF11 domain-containing protein [Clostridiales bacterium]|nr:DUF11 domain-containing protein [Clostridiales bacterium]